MVTEDAREFLAFLTREVQKAQEAGDLDPSVEAEQIAFELDALGAAAHQQFQLVHDPVVFDRAARAMTARLDALAIRHSRGTDSRTGTCRKAVVVAAAPAGTLGPMITTPRFTADLKGRVIGPDHPEYDEARTVFYGGFDRRPELIVRAADAADVARVIALARESGLALAVRSGGHSLAGHGVANGGLVLDLSEMKALDIDPERRTAWAESGVTTGEYTVAAGEHGLATGFGDTGSVGVGGITLAGGVGFLVRRHGLTIDSLEAAEVVTADGELLRADADTHRTCSGRSAAAAATSASPPGSVSACTRSTRSSAACCSCRRPPT
ncbi:MAG TPA: FAD-dependent oxidoreductase [Thermoleophilaceae bacterium]|nr:FAD-dependent oxidoreductase [Thermoleophilaceae bacterium]